MTSPGAPSVVYVAPDKMGGVLSVIDNLLAYRQPDGFSHHVVLTHNTNNVDTRFARPLKADTQATVEFTLPQENLHAVMRRLARAIPPGPGVYVAGDLLDVATASVHDFGRAVILILHGDLPYYYDLAVRHDAIVHAYVAISCQIRDRLLERLPHRADTIFHLPHGIPPPPRVRQSTRGPVRLVFSGRLEKGQKGILDLPPIDAVLRARGVERTWTVVGSGPDEDALMAAWADAPRVRFAGTLAHADAVDLLADHDVFVLPTRHEGFPVALLEAMGAGLVPVVSNIPSGVPDIVESGVTGLMPGVGDVSGFADAIERLAADRGLLDRMSAACRHVVTSKHDVRARVADYQALYARYVELYRPLSAEAKLQYGSRLDQPWIPNAVVRAVRTAQRRARTR